MQNARDALKSLMHEMESAQRETEVQSNNGGASAKVKTWLAPHQVAQAIHIHEERLMEEVQTALMAIYGEPGGGPDSN